MYATVQKFKDRLQQKYDEFYRDSDTGEVDDDLAEDDLVAASADVDSYVAMNYATPVTEAQALPLLAHFNLTLAEELAYLRAGGSSAPDKVVKRVEAVRKQLDKIAEDDRKLPGSPTRSADGAGAAAIVSTATPVFTRDDMEGW